MPLRELAVPGKTHAGQAAHHWPASSHFVKGLFVVSFGPGRLLLYYEKPYFLKLFLAKVSFFTPAFYTPASQRHKPRA